jgi:hypothetical protein
MLQKLIENVGKERILKPWRLADFVSFLLYYLLEEASTKRIVVFHRIQKDQIQLRVWIKPLLDVECILGDFY